ncbi:MAG TPA: hypothetical protein VI215_02820 [Bacteroidota bacterium]
MPEVDPEIVTDELLPALKLLVVPESGVWSVSVFAPTVKVPLVRVKEAPEIVIGVARLTPPDVLLIVKALIKFIAPEPDIVCATAPLNVTD